MSIRTCRVTCRDSRGVEHTIEVTAQSLYEAVAQALRVFRENDWHEDPDRDPAQSWLTSGSQRLNIRSELGILKTG